MIYSLLSLSLVFTIPMAAKALKNALQPTRKYTKKNKKYWENVTDNRRKPLKITYWNA